MKKIGVISDTHFHSLADGAALIERLRGGCFRDVDAIIHAGDMVHPDVALLFAEVPFYPVLGNMDQASSEVPVKRIVEIDGWRIGVMHGWGTRHDLEPRVLAQFAGQRIDCLVYGHSHRPVCHWHDDLLIVNPGSAADRRQAPWHSVAILYLDKTLQGEIINIDDAG